MIVFYIVGLSMKTSRNDQFVDSNDSAIEKTAMMMTILIEMEKDGPKRVF
jgi:hypothetical protein